MIHVAVGIVIDPNQKVLVAERHQTLWEFPGGKVEEGETVFAALCREFKEEVDLDVHLADPFIKVEHQYDQYSVLLDIWTIHHFSGVAKGLEGQAIRWVDLTQLRDLSMPEANHVIIDKLILDFLHTTTH